MRRHPGPWPPTDIGGGIYNRDGVARTVADGIGDPEYLDATAFIIDTARHRAVDDRTRAGLNRQVARDRAMQDQPHAPMQCRIATMP